jgi:hypothetical protein
MKNIILKSKLIFMTLVTVLAVSCSADDSIDRVVGDAGTQSEEGLPGTDGANGTNGSDGVDGANGEDGANGTNGSDGEDGTDGEDGNTNVIASDWLEPTEDSYSVNNARYKSLVLADRISQNIMMEGVFLVYYDNDVEITLLPKNYLATGVISKTVETSINRASRRLYVSIRKFNSDLIAGEYLWNPSGPAYNKGIRFRYVIIPSVTNSKNNSPDFKKMSYENVMNHFELAH